MRARCHVGEGLVDGDAFYGRREIAQDSDGGVAEPLVFVEMSADKHEVGTELPRAPSRHAASYAEGPRFVGGREHDAAADRNRLAAQARVEQLFDRRIKGVEVRVENGGCGTHLARANKERKYNPLTGPPHFDCFVHFGQNRRMKSQGAEGDPESDSFAVQPRRRPDHVATFRNSRGEALKPSSVSASEAKSEFG